MTKYDERDPHEKILHCTAPHCTAQILHCTAPHCTALHCTALHRTAPHRTAQHCTALHCTALHRTAPHCTARRMIDSTGNAPPKTSAKTENSDFSVQIQTRTTFAFERVVQDTGNLSFPFCWMSAEFSRSLLPHSVEPRPMRLRLETFGPTGNQHKTQPVAFGVSFQSRIFATFCCNETKESEIGFSSTSFKGLSVMETLQRLHTMTRKTLKRC